MKKQKTKIPFFAKLRKIIFKIFFWFFLITISWVVIARFVPIYVTPLMVIRSIEAISNDKKPRNKKEWIPISGISQNMIQAVVASEDNLFMSHNGFSFEDIKKAMEHNKKKKRIRGGSTISQQTAKNVFLWPQRSWVRKGLETYFTFLIELLWSKERIMEVYLNVIEMGDGIYGVQAASQHYFNKNADKLTKSQSALIAVCLPNPRKFNPANPSSYIQRRRDKIVNLMGKVEQVKFEKKKD